MAYSKIKLDGFTWITGSPTDLNNLKINKVTTKYVVVIEDTIVDVDSIDAQRSGNSYFVNVKYGIGNSLMLEAGNAKDLDNLIFFTGIFGEQDSYLWVATEIDGEGKIKGTEGHDEIEGSKGKDKIKGNDGIDIIYAEKGKDKVKGGDGQDILLGGKGNDKIKGNSGSDRIEGENGDDKLYGGNSGDGIFGGKGNDKLYGDSGDDELNGDSGNDRLYGGSGYDRLFGGAGNDLLQGGASFDDLTGGSGADVFRFNLVSDSTLEGGAWDQITDFTPGEDIIDVSTIDALLTFTLIGNTVVNNAFDFIGTNNFSGSGAELRYEVIGSSTFITGETLSGSPTVFPAGNGTFYLELTNFTGSLTADDFIL